MRGIRKIFALVSAVLLCTASVSCSYGAEQTAITNSKSDNSSSIESNADDSEKKASINNYEHDILSYDGIVSQCSACENAMKHRLAVEYATACSKKSGESHEKVELYLEKCDEFEQLVYEDMQHNCFADVVTVENYPFTFKHYSGVYTGSWQGAGPVGEGTFDGIDIRYGTGYSYTGDWRFGLPDGFGSYFEELGYGNNTTIYTGQMRAGMKNGTGRMTEKLGDIAYRYFDEGTYENDVMTSVTQFCTINMDGSLNEIGTMKASGNYLDYVTQKSARAIKGEIETVVGIAAGIAIYSVIDSVFDAFTTDHPNPYSTPVEQQIAYANECNAKNEAERKAAIESAEAERKRIDDQREDEYRNLIKNDPEMNNADTQRAAAAAGYHVPWF